MKRIMMALSLAALMVAVLLPAGAATAQREVVKVKVGPTAEVLDDSTVVQVEVSVKCEPPAEILEALVTVSQGEGAASGEAGITSVVCDGKKRTRTVEVQTLDSTFHPGEAFVSSLVLVCLDAECVQTADGQDSRLVRVVGS